MGHTRAVAPPPPPILLKDGPQDFFKIEEKMAGYRMSKKIFEKCLKTHLKQSLSWREMKNGKRLILALSKFFEQLQN